MIYNFNKHGVEYIFDSENNLDIPNFKWFMNVLNDGEWENNTFTIFKSVADKTKWALDIGGWIGPTAIWLSNNFKSVVVVEADRIAISALKMNLKTSNCKNVSIIDRPIYDKSGVDLWFGGNEFRNAGLGESTSQLKTKGTFDDQLMTTISLSDILDKFGREDLGFIKVDIEGGEEAIIPHLFTEASMLKVPIWLSFHISWWTDKNVERYLDYFKMATNINSDSLIAILKNTTMCDVLFEFKI
jgi:FkbM family methyltransferase